MSQAAAFALGVVNSSAAFNRTARVYYSPWDQYVFIDSTDPGFSQLMAGTGDFCIEMFLNIAAESSQGLMVSFGRYSGFTDGNLAPVWRVTIDNEIAGQGFSIVGTTGGGGFGGTTNAYPNPVFGLDTPAGLEGEASLLEEWHHFAWIRKDNTLQLYVDGVPCERYKQYWNPVFGADISSEWIDGKIEHFNNYSSPVAETAFEIGATYMINYASNTNWYPILGEAGVNGARFVATTKGSGIGFTPINGDTGQYDTVLDGSFSVGSAYVIKTLGNTDWFSVGAGSSPFVGQNFVAKTPGGTQNGMFTRNATVTVVTSTVSSGTVANWGVMGIFGTYGYNGVNGQSVTPTAPGDFTPDGAGWGLLDRVSAGNFYMVTNIGDGNNYYWTNIGCSAPPTLGQVFQATAAGSQGGSQAAILVVKPGSFVTNQTYQIITVGNTDWAAVGGRVSAQVGDVFIATGAGGSGTTGLTAPASPAVSDGSFVVGAAYQIVTPGTTNWTAIGAANNNQSTCFVATGVGGSGTGKAVPATSGPIVISAGGGTVVSTLLSSPAQMGSFSSSSPYLITQNATYSGNSPLNVGQTYWIATIGNTNWSNVGATQPYSVGQSFVATQAYTYSPNDGLCVGVDWSSVGATSTPTPPPAVGTIFTATGAGNSSTVTGPTNGYALKLTSSTPVADGSFVVGNLYAVATVGNTNWPAVGSIGTVGSQFVATSAGTVGGTGTAVSVVPVSGYGNVSDGSFYPQMTYMIKTPGTTNWTSIGASANTAGTLFSATSTGAGGNGVAVQFTAVATGNAIKDLGAGNAISFSSLPSLYSFGGPYGSPPSAEPYNSPYNNVFYWRNYRYTVGNAVYTPNGVNGSFTPPLWWEDLTPTTGTKILMVPGSGVTAPTTNGGTFTNEASPTTAIAIQNKWSFSGSATITTLPLNNIGLTFPVIGAGTNTAASYTATNATTQDTTANGRPPVIGTTFGSFTSGTPTLIRDTSSTALDVSNKSFFIEGWVWIPVSPAVQPRVVITAQTTNSVGIVIGDSATAPTTIDAISLIAFPGNTVQYSANVIWARGQWNYFAVQREVSSAKQHVWFWTGVQGQYAAKLLNTIGTQNTTIFNYANAGATGVSIGGISTGSSASDFGINMLNVIVDAIVPNYASFGPGTNTVGTGLAVGRGISMTYSVPTVTTNTTLVMGFQGTNGGTTFNNQTS